MNQLIKHNDSLKLAIENMNLKELDDVINLDSIDLVLRECLTLEEMKEAGSFFTGQSLATATVNLFPEAITFNSVVLDPTCGAGNLLIECSRKLGVETYLTDTLKKWARVLWGFDIHESFVESTKLRLVVEAIRRGVRKDCSIEEAIFYFENIRVRNILTVNKSELELVTHAIINPPFSIWPSPNNNYWKAGKINAAGIVFDHLIRVLPEYCNFSAILPDVLRSGSRYASFREYCSLKTESHCKVWGKFNNKTDVDVFTLSGILFEQDENNEIGWQEKLNPYQKISDHFDVRIGPLVAYRDPDIGQTYPFIHAKNTPAWQVLDEIGTTRKYQGTVVASPFVVVKRTSSPGDKFRAVATIINLKGSEIAVENHMIVIKPKNNTLSDCRKLLKILKSDSTNDFLNKRIRLRHLTVQAIKDIPIN